MQYNSQQNQKQNIQGQISNENQNVEGQYQNAGEQ